jgi:hypothetical protein
MERTSTGSKQESDVVNKRVIGLERERVRRPNVHELWLFTLCI